MALNIEQNIRYSRQIMLDEIGTDGQEKLLKSSVLIIGAGGLGSPAALYLAAAGIGTIGIADEDIVDLSNLQRQILHNVTDIGKAKISSAKTMVENLNPDVHINTYQVRIAEENILQIINEYDFVLDCTDNFTSKFLINDACVTAGKPYSHAGVMGFQGQLMTVIPKQTPCYRCVFENPPPEDTNKKLGIIGTVCGVIGSLQAMEAIKYILNIGELLTETMLTFDGLTMNFRKIRLPERDDLCPACGTSHTVFFYDEP